MRKGSSHHQELDLGMICIGSCSVIKQLGSKSSTGKMGNELRAHLVTELSKIPAQSLSYKRPGSIYNSVDAVIKHFLLDANSLLYPYTTRQWSGAVAVLQSALAITKQTLILLALGLELTPTSNVNRAQSHI